ncbi:thioredoxin fold domain-containing protein [Thaumasiovibrio subtropicus]|uniref:thioredoxin fold domain-containing protein n=1 Tax=Thaumasiovibrio subtropicus TaxID=1891207 RepID=UPI000B35DDC0|nr:thioredoxin fold domain-containing protein [Thaumasiovibrio subtropicus]
MAGLQRVLSILSLVFLSLVISAEEVTTPLKVIPTPESHGAFLLKPWQEGAPVLVMFKDPFCPYCLRAIENRHQLDDYNVFLFWAPILGERSEQRVATFFRCATPVNDTVLKAAVQRAVPDCQHQDLAQAVWQQNNRMVEAYQPRYVPQYWYAGQRVQISGLQRQQHAPTIAPNNEVSTYLPTASPLQLPLARYGFHAANTHRQGNLAMLVVVPDDIDLLKAQRAAIAADTEFNWYVFDTVSRCLDDVTFSGSAEAACVGNETAQRRKNRLEILMLTGTSTPLVQPHFYLEGIALNPAQFDTVVPESIKQQFERIP